ncbi:hypothetical protein SmJEL517_g01001 [Synchytrium microbalum]|uniref:DNA 3'-5' helicase n=1 Tax=Synchytrium microbalum TaxID=1806994 RepID=A0A507CG41_9FUNG|nr:uncharacterized protein SmJEL517_g01001 [Synchytrium microbalum]TPX36966.1 hypothetical protein SmJEL517_g01001 [Synchytrium microbalum]
MAKRRIVDEDDVDEGSSDTSHSRKRSRATGSTTTTRPTRDSEIIDLTDDADPSSLISNGKHSNGGDISDDLDESYQAPDDSSEDDVEDHDIEEQEAASPAPSAASSSRKAKAKKVVQPVVDDDFESEPEETPKASKSRTIPVLTQKKSKQKDTVQDEVTELFEERDTDYTHLRLKEDHELRPLYITNDNIIILEAFSPIADQAQDFLVAIAEPVSRPSHVHEYRLTEYSLYAAVSVGLETESIIEVLNRLSKVAIPPRVEAFIKKYTVSYGKVKLLLQHNRYYVESKFPEVLERLIKDDVIKETVLGDAQLVETGGRSEAIVFPTEAPTVSGAAPSITKPTVAAKITATNGSNASSSSTPVIEPVNESTDEEEQVDEQQQQRAPMQAEELEGIWSEQQPQQLGWMADVMNEDTDTDNTKSFEIDPAKAEQVRKRCSDLNYPMLEEYDFRKDERNPNTKIDLKPSTTLRPYQAKALSKMFGNGRARSGIIVLPCGAGKTLTGVAAACTIKKSVLVLCWSAVSVAQWIREFQHWSTALDIDVGRFDSETKKPFKAKAGILVSTYSMVAYSGNRAYDAQKMMKMIESQEWGLLILDEVHVVPADMFRKTLTVIKVHCKLGLTATLVREDNKIENLNYLIGPKLYEANWLDLAQKGHIANVQCAEVWCSMTPEFYKEYLKQSSRKKQLLYAMNPRKLQACQYLIERHEQAGDKIIVFSDNVFALKHYANKLNKPYIYGQTSQQNRLQVLSNFRHNPALNTIFLSKIGDTSIDIPEATVLIQISSHYGSRRQEAQRLGRILRAKRRNDDGFNAFFYTLVSKDTVEMVYSGKRQQFLIDQGYAFKVITNLDGADGTPNQVYATKSQQIELLTTVLIANDKEDYIEKDDDVENSLIDLDDGAVVRRVGNISSLSGADSMAYMEYTSGSSSKNKPKFKKYQKRFD